MGALVVCGVLVLAFVLSIWIYELTHKGIDLIDQRRNRENLRRRNIWRNAGGMSYPHELADGRTRWYHVDRDDAVEL